eukprot:TRINITY_DN8601_c0_g2_i1.p1 TRINITY_DN8601_c0_g2~~TRINITY_DN8601_c0_g2_i1.p1  ORF type:complete len:396 (+),score=45.26 TRINITY_DN8601_c0_g2_i1:82-1269(+)
MAKRRKMDGADVGLSLIPSTAWAYSEAKASWTKSSAKWDYVSFFVGEASKRRRKAWWWCQGKQEIAVNIEEPGEYEFEYHSDGGYFTNGIHRGSLAFLVRSPVVHFEIPRQAKAGDHFDATWNLSSMVGPNYVVLMQVTSADADVTVQSLQMARYTNESSLAGCGRFAVPRVGGEYTLLVRGSSCANSMLEKRSMQVEVPEQIRSQTFVQFQSSSGTPTRAIVAAPESKVHVEWCFPLAVNDDALAIVSGVTPPKVVPLARKVSNASGSSGSAQVQVPLEPGQYCVCLCAAYRSGQVLLPAAFCHLFVSPLLSLAPGTATEFTPPAPAPAESPDEASAGSKPQCIICLSADVSVVLLPCGHAQFCNACISRSLERNRKCPVCREIVADKHIMYLP